MSHIFISYSRRDKRIVEQFVEGLKKQDFIVWQDVSNITAGAKWEQVLLDAIENASAVLVFWSLTASTSKYVQAEIEHAFSHNKLVIPIWLNKDVDLKFGLEENNAVIAFNYSPTKAKELTTILLKIAPRLQREVTDFKPNLPMNEQSIEGTVRETIGGEEYIVIPLVNSVYSKVRIIAKANTIVGKSTRIQLIVQNTRNVGYKAVQSAFDTIISEDEKYPDEKQPVVGLYISGAINPMDESVHWVDPTNVAHYSDMVDTVNKAIAFIDTKSESHPTFQVFQMTLVDISFLLGVQMDRWLPLQLYKWVGSEYLPIINIPPRAPN